MTTIALKLREDAFYTETSTGTYVLLPHGEVTLEGSSVHRWIERLAPHLDGSRSLEELTDALPAPRRDFVAALVRTLLERAIVQEIVREPVPQLAAEVADPNPAEIGFVGYFRTPAVPALNAYREAMSLVVGSGPLVPGVVRSLVRSGVRRVRAAVTGESATDVSLLGDCAVQAGRQTPPQVVEWQRLGTDGGLPELVATAGLVVHVSGRPMGQRSLWLEQECARRGIPLAQAGVDADGLWIGPAGVPGPDHASLASGWLRRAAMRAAVATSPEEVSPTSAAAVVTANLLVHDAFRYATGTRSAPGPPALTRVSLDGIPCDAHRLLAHPCTHPAGPRSEEQFLARISQLEEQPAMTEEEFSQRAAALADERLGIFGEVSEGDFAQLPLHVAQAAVSDPMNLLGQLAAGAPRPMATGAGLDFRAARFQTALRALAMYGSLMVDPRRFIPPGGSTVVPLRDAQVHAIGLTDGRVHLVPAMVAFPALRRPASPYLPPVGTAAGYSWCEALEAALIGLCLRLGVAEALRSHRQFPRVDLDAAPLDAAAVRLLAYLACTGEPVVVHDVTGSLEVPTVACSLGGRLMAYGCGTTVTEALRDGLERLVLSWQAEVNGEPAYAPRTWPRIAPVGNGPPRKPVARLPLDLGALAGALRRHGQIPLAVPLDHDDELHARMPFLVHVVTQPCSID